MILRGLLKVYRWNPVVLIALLSSGAALGQAVTDGEKRWAAMQSAVNNAQSAEIRLDAGQRRAGADDDRPGLALLRWLVRKKNVLGT